MSNSASDFLGNVDVSCHMSCLPCSRT